MKPSPLDGWGCECCDRDLPVRLVDGIRLCAFCLEPHRADITGCEHEAR